MGSVRGENGEHGFVSAFTRLGQASGEHFNEVPPFTQLPSQHEIVKWTIAFNAVCEDNVHSNPRNSQPQQSEIQARKRSSSNRNRGFPHQKEIGLLSLGKKTV